MANNQAQFDAHQKMMKGRYDSAYKQNQQWLQEFRGSGGAGSGGSGSSDFGSHEKFIDSINETTSFDDPDYEHRVSKDGQGIYIGPDDPSFDPNALDGNYHEIEMLN